MAVTHRSLAHVGQSQLVQSALPRRAQPAEHVWHSRPSYPSAHWAWRKASWLRRSRQFSSVIGEFGIGVMLKKSSQVLFPAPSFVSLLAAPSSLNRRCRLPAQAFLESHSSIFKHASDVTRPVRGSFLPPS